MPIRPMRLADSDDVARLSNDLGYAVLEAQVAQRFHRLKSGPESEVFVAPDVGALAGWVHVHGIRLLESDGYAEIGGLVVSPAHRRRGIGTALLQVCERWAIEHGYDRIRLRSGIHRGEAHRFYARVGYEQAKASYAFELRLPRP